MYNISKELFEAVMEWDDINIFQILEDEISYTRYANVTRGMRDGYISYNDFFFKCKEWAKKLNHNVFSTHICNSDEYICILNLGAEDDEKGFLSTSEQEAVFDACMYILEQSKNKEYINEI